MAEERVVSRRRHSAQSRATVLAQCAAPGASVAKVSMAHGLNTNLVHGWRKQARDCAVAVPTACMVAAPAKPTAGMLQPGLANAPPEHRGHTLAPPDYEGVDAQPARDLHHRCPAGRYHHVRHARDGRVEFPSAQDTAARPLKIKTQGRGLVH